MRINQLCATCFWKELATSLIYIIVLIKVKYFVLLFKTGIVSFFAQVHRCGQETAYIA